MESQLAVAHNVTLILRPAEGCSLHTALRSSRADKQMQLSICPGETILDVTVNVRTLLESRMKHWKIKGDIVFEYDAAGLGPEPKLMGWLMRHFAQTAAVEAVLYVRGNAQGNVVLNSERLLPGDRDANVADI